MELVEVNKLAAETGGAFLNDFVPGANAASTSTAILSNSLDDYITTNKKALFTMDQFKKSVFDIAAKTKDGFKEGNLRIHIMGNEFERANLRVIEARKSIEDIWKAGKGKEDTAKMFNEASQSLVSAQIEIEKLRQDTVEGIKQKYTELYIQRLKEAGAGVTALEEEQSLRMSLIKK
jgi:hypothetical protein